MFRNAQWILLPASSSRPLLPPPLVPSPLLFPLDWPSTLTVWARASFELFISSRKFLCDNMVGGIPTSVYMCLEVESGPSVHFKIASSGS